jgi:hypothetical protein
MIQVRKLVCEKHMNHRNARCNNKSKTTQVVFDYILPVYFMILYNTTGMSHLKADKLMIRVTKIKAMLF